MKRNTGTNGISRRMIAARQIEAAMKLRGLSRKQFSELMHRNPSEVTKWLSGNHNFTISLLQEISEVLDVEISGVEDVGKIIKEYTAESNESVLEEPATQYGVEGNLTTIIRRRSAELGISAQAYLYRLVENDIRSLEMLPKVDLNAEPCEQTKRYSGIVKFWEVPDDERFKRIWNR